MPSVSRWRTIVPIALRPDVRPGSFALIGARKLCGRQGRPPLREPNRRRPVVRILPPAGMSLALPPRVNDRRIRTLYFRLKGPRFRVMKGTAVSARSSELFGVAQPDRVRLVGFSALALSGS